MSGLDITRAWGEMLPNRTKLITFNNNLKKIINTNQFEIWGQDWFESFEINYCVQFHFFYSTGNNTVWQYLLSEKYMQEKKNASFSPSWKALLPNRLKFTLFFRKSPGGRVHKKLAGQYHPQYYETTVRLQGTKKERKKVKEHSVPKHSYAAQVITASVKSFTDCFSSPHGRHSWKPITLGGRGCVCSEENAKITELAWVLFFSFLAEWNSGLFSAFCKYTNPIIPYNYVFHWFRVKYYLRMFLQLTLWTFTN